MMSDDETIAAWLGGMLDAEGANAMTGLAARDEAFARRVARLQHIDELVRAAVPAEEAVPDALLERLGLAPAAVASAQVVDLAAVRAVRSAPVLAPARRAGGGFLRMAAQLALVAGVGLAVVAINRPAEDPAADYRALGSAPEAAAREANVLVKFAPGVPADEAARLAAGSGLKLLGEPNAAGGWKAAVKPGQRAAALEALRKNDRVLMAEPIDGAGQ